MDPRISFRDISAKYTGTCDEVIPTQMPLINRPQISMGIPLHPAWRDVPRSHQMHAKNIESRRPNLLEIGPAMIAPMTEPPASPACIPPCVVPCGFLKYSTYWSVPMIAEIDEISKPNLF